MSTLPFVDWDVGAAERAIMALQNAARKLRDTASERQRSAAAATKEWKGPYRQVFDAHIARAVREAQHIADEYDGAAQLIKRYDAQAHELSRRRQQNEQQKHALV